MSTEAVYLIQISKEMVEVFSQSMTGVLNFAGVSSATDPFPGAKEIASSLLGTPEPMEEVELMLQDSFGVPPLYEASQSRTRIWRYGKPGPIPKETMGFLFRYPAWRQACRQGDFIAAGTAIQRSKKLKAFRPLLRYLAGEDAFLIFAVYWLSAFDADKLGYLAQLFSGNVTLLKDNPYEELFDFARLCIQAMDLSEFRKEVLQKLEAYLCEKQGRLILPLVGENFGRASSELRARSSEALAEGRRRALVEGITGFEDRVRQWLEGVSFAVLPDPCNKADANAISVLARFPEDGRTYLAGYLRADVSALLAPLLRKGLTFKAILHWLDGKELQIALMRTESTRRQG
ncbi:MAG: hypothetical protein FD137_1337 [Spirochaetes bacterium]|nr:MAG: hypothetical protein FD137_1337 [Spirochaetota bacterium]